MAVTPTSMKGSYSSGLVQEIDVTNSDVISGSHGNF